MIRHEHFLANEYYNSISLLFEDAHKDNRKIDIANKTVKTIVDFIESQLTPEERIEIKTNMYNREWSGAEKKIQKPNNIKKTDAGFEFTIFQNVNGDNKPLNVVICNKNIFPNDVACYEDEYNVLILPFLYNNNDVLDLYAIRSIYLSRGVLIHELIHWVDDIDFGLDGKTQNEDYYNSPDEFDVYSIQMINFLREQILSDKGLRNQIEKFTEDGFFAEFWNRLVNSNFLMNNAPLSDFEPAVLNRFYNSLTERNKRRLIKRVASYFTEVLTKIKQNNKRLESILVEDIKYTEQVKNF